MYIELLNKLDFARIQLQLKVDAHDGKLAQLEEAVQRKYDQLAQQRHEFEECLRRKDDDLVHQRQEFEEFLRRKDDDLVHQRQEFEEFLRRKDDDLVQQRQQFVDLLRKKDDDFAQQRDHYEARLAESRSDRADAIASDKQNSLILQKHLLQMPRLVTPSLKGNYNSPSPIPSPNNVFIRIREPCPNLALGQKQPRVLYTEAAMRPCRCGQHACPYRYRRRCYHGQEIPG